MPCYALIHSPLVGPATWAALGPELESRGHRVIIPRLVDDGRPPYWAQHAAAAADGIDACSPAEPVVLVAHSGAGLLVPAVLAATDSPIAAAVFLDAGLPRAGSRLDALAAEMGEAAAVAFRAHLEGGGRYPEWSDADLAPLIPDRNLRAAILHEVTSRAGDFWREPLDVPPAIGVACGYLQLSPAYTTSAAEARGLRWPVMELQASHFHMLADPTAVADALEAITAPLLKR